MLIHKKYENGPLRELHTVCIAPCTRNSVLKRMQSEVSIEDIESRRLVASLLPKRWQSGDLLSIARVPRPWQCEEVRRVRRRAGENRGPALVPALIRLLIRARVPVSHENSSCVSPFPVLLGIKINYIPLGIEGLK